MAGAERGVERGKDMAGPDWRIRGVVGRRADALKDCVDRGGEKVAPGVAMQVARDEAGDVACVADGVDLRLSKREHVA
eukprot:CAMPEP_0113680116 /NCGR_PEP_ID=MMETSP0038_2-20120614/11094_1 /TAXON_ID=2898 /ORGANISM="Cryptomonas paramecium" /LENGTH=77 /DNA_ID=CAMNT_0000598369 /DNA_START=169 /DNA_END=401 /DNA_ORIENTATION=- /assembly_acc=CAM_ASM_000170